MFFLVIVGPVPETVSRQESQMKTCIVLFVLVTLTIYCHGRTRWSMIKYDEEVDRTKAYKLCMRDCKKLYEGSGDPDRPCQEGLDDAPMVDDGHHGCAHHLILHQAPQPDEPKRPFEVADLWKLFEAK